MTNLSHIQAQAAQAAAELLAAANLKPGSILVVGCSSSEIIGQTIGKCSSLEAAQAVYQGIAPVLHQAGVFLVAQCCEHLNRALILEAAAVRVGAEVVNVMPQPKAGGSFATVCWQQFEHPVALESIQADAGLDIGSTLIGMHLKRVAVPVRLNIQQIGQASLVAARTRPRYIGGPRAVYQEGLA